MTKLFVSLLGLLLASYRHHKRNKKIKVQALPEVDVPWIKAFVPGQIDDEAIFTVESEKKGWPELNYLDSRDGASGCESVQWRMLRIFMLAVFQKSPIQLVSTRQTLEDEIYYLEYISYKAWKDDLPAGYGIVDQRTDTIIGSVDFSHRHERCDGIGYTLHPDCGAEVMCPGCACLDWPGF